MRREVRVKVETEKGNWVNRYFAVDVPEGAGHLEVMRAASEAVQPYLASRPRWRVVAIDVSGGK